MSVAYTNARWFDLTSDSMKLKKLGSDALVELFAGKNHGSLMDQKLRDRIAKEMAEQFRKAQATLK